ncbi:MAG: Uma2 family endonuclease [Leptospiraceae bacterium]|nr:Uma2 family endonuclease [Leptospiraceae bacterium]
MSIGLLEISNIQLTKITVNDYALLCRENPFHYEKTELLEGVIIDKMTKSNEHDFYSQVFFEEIQKILPTDFFIRSEKGILFSDSELEPDISVIKGKIQDYRNSKPKTARLVIEIAISSLSYDREKAKTYAKGLVEEYWIVDVANKSLEVYTQPKSDSYSDKKIFSFTEEISIFNSKISLIEILG